MGAFDTINYLLYNKSKKELDNELLVEFDPYLTLKAFSFYGQGTYVNFINDTLNSYSKIFKTEEDRFRFFENVIPKLKKSKFEYIKRPKKEKVEEVKLPVPEFYSQREIDDLKKCGMFD